VPRPYRRIRARGETSFAGYRAHNKDDLPRTGIHGATVRGTEFGVFVEGVTMVFGSGFLQYAVVFFILAILAAVVGARGIAGISMEIARILVVLFIVLAIISLLL